MEKSGFGDKIIIYIFYQLIINKGERIMFQNTIYILLFYNYFYKNKFHGMRNMNNSLKFSQKNSITLMTKENSPSHVFFTLFYLNIFSVIDFYGIFDQGCL